MDDEVCVICNTENNIEKFHNKYRKCKLCHIQPSMKRYYEIKDKLSNQRNLFSEKN